MTDETQGSPSEKREPILPSHHAYHVAERGEGKKPFWTRIGAAWQHEDGQGLTLQLDLMPVTGGKIVLRTRKAGAEAETQEETGA
jgi:hypothetical protein